MFHGWNGTVSSYLMNQRYILSLALACCDLFFFPFYVSLSIIRFLSCVLYLHSHISLPLKHTRALVAFFIAQRIQTICLGE